MLWTERMWLLRWARVEQMRPHSSQRTVVPPTPLLAEVPPPPFTGVATGDVAACWERLGEVEPLGERVEDDEPSEWRRRGATRVMVASDGLADMIGLRRRLVDVWVAAVTGLPIGGRFTVKAAKEMLFDVALAPSLLPVTKSEDVLMGRRIFDPCCTTSAAADSPPPCDLSATVPGERGLIIIVPGGKCVSGCRCSSWPVAAAAG